MRASAESAEGVDSELAGAADRRPAQAQPSPLRARELALCLLLYGALGLWWLWPLPSLAASQTFDFSGPFDLIQADFQLITWALAWGAHAIARSPLHLFHANIFSPSTLALAYTDHFLGYAPLYAPTFWLTGNAVLATNVMIIALQPLCALAMYALARRFVGPPPALLAGLLFGFMPWRLVSLAHFHILGIQYLPLALLFTERWLDTARAREAVLLALCLTLQAASSAYLAFALAIAYGAYLPFALWGFRRSLDRRRVIGWVAAVGFTGAVFGALALPYARLRNLGLIPAYDDPTSSMPLGLYTYTIARAMSAFFDTQSFGRAAYTLAGLALLPPWRGRGRAIGIAVSLTALGTLFAYGPELQIGSHLLWSPYQLLVRFVPGFSSIRLPVRFIVVVQVGMSLLAALGLAAVSSFLPRVLAWPAALVAIALAAWTAPPLLDLPHLVEQPVGARLPAAVAWLGQHGDGRPLLELPPSKFSDRTRRMLLSTAHWLPLVDGYSGYTPRSPEIVYAAARKLPAAEGLTSLLDVVDVGWILVHLDQLPENARQAWNGPLPPGVEVAGRWDDALLLRVTERGDPTRQARLLDPHRTLEGTPLEPLDDNCPGEVRLVAGLPDPRTTETTVRVRVEVRNDSDRPWPGRSALPRHRLVLVACLGDSSEATCRGEPTDLPADVPPHGSVAVDVPVHAPLFAGERALRIELLQRGDGFLDRCGARPLRLTVRAAYPARS